MPSASSSSSAKALSERCKERLWFGFAAVLLVTLQSLMSQPSPTGDVVIPSSDDMAAMSILNSAMGRSLSLLSGGQPTSNQTLSSALNAVIYASSSSSVAPLQPNGNNDNNTLLDDVVRLLLPPDQAEEYIRLYPGERFHFYVYDNLPEGYRWPNVSQCIAEKHGFPSNCDWGASICTETNSTFFHWSKRRFNRNADVVMAKVFEEYQGPLRTYDLKQADLFVVPYPIAGHCECRGKRSCINNVPPEEVLDLLATLPYFNNATLHRHLFLISNIWWDAHRWFKDLDRIPLQTNVGPCTNCKLGMNCGQIVIPYANTNKEYQPQVITHKPWEERQYAMAGFMTVSIDGDRSDRKSFHAHMKAWEKSRGKNNFTLAGRPILYSGLERRSITGEANIQATYRDSIFCPIISGDAPPQKRVFDAILGGCIPVVMRTDDSDEDGYKSHFFRPKFSIRKSYPFSQGSFFGAPDMGVDWDELAVSIDRDANDCDDLSCFLPELERLMLHQPEILRAKQERITKLARLFSYGMEHNGLQHVDAIATLLVQARHYINARSLQFLETRGHVPSVHEFRKKNKKKKKKEIDDE